MELDLNSESYRSLGERLQGIHDQLLEIAPDVERVACALYDSSDDLLKTFINSTRNGEALAAHQYRLQDSESLSYLARTRELRVIDNVQEVLRPTTVHSEYVLNEGYESSFTIPMYYQGDLFGFIFFDSRRKDTFTPALQRELVLYANIITMAVANELMAIRSIMGTVGVARDIAEFRDFETGAHLNRMSRYARVIARGVAEQHALNDEFIEQIYLYAPLHDIGKIAIPDRILLKPGRLDPEEWEIMKTHTTRGREMIERITLTLHVDRLPNDELLKNIVELHHEAMDGSGYPRGLAGEDIPLEARIISVADVFDALVSERPYKTGWAVDDAIAELERMARDGKLDPDCVAAAKARRDELHEAFLRYPDVVD
ncbi:MAG: HD domain-containing protein [Actinomycetales bacterium]|nr:HD domain-containing protein [Actinomycetales bacterium]